MGLIKVAEISIDKLEDRKTVSAGMLGAGELSKNEN